MREVQLASRATEGSTFAACVATILELPLGDVPEPPPGEDAAGWRISRWLGGLGLGLVPVLEPKTFAWPGPWIGIVSAGGKRRAVVMYGNPAGVVYDPAGDSDGWELEAGYTVAAADIALARPRLPEAPETTGVIEALFVSPEAAAPARALERVRAIAGSGLDGDRHTVGKGTFPSGMPGSALTLIEAEVCESFAPALSGDDHRRNVVTRGIDLNRLVGHEFTLGGVRCRGMRLCEPCTVIQRYAERPILRPLVHRGGLRADILADGELLVGDEVRAG
jgi:hypothetical protein